MNERGAVSGYTVADEFGTWNDGLRAAGLDPQYHADISKSALLTAITTLAEELGHAPRQRTWIERGKYGLDAVVDRFGTWTAAVEAAGYTPISQVHVNGKVPTRTIIESIRSVAENLDRAPTGSEFREHGAVTPQTVKNRFGSFRAGIRAAGFEPHEPRAYSKEVLLEAVQSLAEELGRPPTTGEMDELGAVAASTVANRFTSWNAALEAAGLGVNRESNITDADLARSLRRLGCQLGRPPEYTDHHRARYTVTTYQNRFGTWANAAAAAGYDTSVSEPRHPRYYGPNWTEQREAALQRDAFVCQMPGCDVDQKIHFEKYGCELHVHHIQPLRGFTQESGYARFDHANTLNNLVTLCADHHPVWELMVPLVPDTRHLDD
ncbi:homing endonuclease associated repeat-containing protein [Halobaculum lipolyticum]|nr:hypothetical protein [Halobaculum sp. DT31]